MYRFLFLAWFVIASIVSATPAPAAPSITQQLTIKAGTEHNPITQLEFLVLLGRFFSITNDLAPTSIISSPLPVPRWAESEIRIVQHKFGTLIPYYLDAYTPNQVIPKSQISKFITAYIFSDSKPNASLPFSSKNGQSLTAIHILPDTTDAFLTKKEVVAAFQRAYQHRLQHNSANQPSKKMPILHAVLSPLHGHFGVSSGYFWRGISQTQTRGVPHVYGQFTTDITDQFTLGTWISNVYQPQIGSSAYEWDIYAQYTNAISSIPDLTYQLGLTYYAYPNRNDFSELSAGLQYRDRFTLTHYALLTSPTFSSFAKDHYFTFHTTTPLPESFRFITQIGYYTGSVNLTSDQWDYSIGLQKMGLTVSLLGTLTTPTTPHIQIKYDRDIF